MGINPGVNPGVNKGQKRKNYEKWVSPMNSPCSKTPTYKFLLILVICNFFVSFYSRGLLLGVNLGINPGGQSGGQLGSKTQKLRKMDITNEFPMLKNPHLQVFTYFSGVYFFRFQSRVRGNTESLNFVWVLPSNNENEMADYYNNNVIWRGKQCFQCNLMDQSRLNWS